MKVIFWKKYCLQEIYLNIFFYCGHWQHTYSISYIDVFIFFYVISYYLIDSYSCDFYIIPYNI